MICLKCGNEMKEFEQVCSKCGYNKDTVSNTENPFGVKSQGIYNPNAVDKEEAQEKLDHQKQFHELAEIYMGPMYYNFKKGSFSWCAFFLGPIYIAYRKMISVSVIVYIINMVLMTVFKNNALIYLAVSLLFNLFLGLSFKKIYFDDSMEKVGKIKQQNPDLGFNQLTELIKQKGGTNILYPVILILVVSIILTILYITIGFQFPKIRMPHVNIPNI